MENPLAVPPPNLPSKRPVNKQMPDDWRKQQEAKAVVQKIKADKKQRERKLQEI
jgi:hypothetical protein